MTHQQAAFINPLAEEGTKAEAIEWLQKAWNEECELRAENERLRAAGNGAFMAMCAYRDGGDLESFQDAIDALGGALTGKEGK